MHTDLPLFADQQIIAMRPARNRVDPLQPYACIVEAECGVDRLPQQVVTIFLTSSECSFHCTMCDLWKNTLQHPVARGAIPQQIRQALESRNIDFENPGEQDFSTIKLYNSGNFFDRHAVPLADWPAIANLVNGFSTVIVENHPRLCGEACFEFQKLLTGQLELALGLETVHPRILPWLNKQMTLEDFRLATSKLLAGGVRVRTFILLKPPFLTEEEGIYWARRSMEFAFDCGVECCSLVPVRGGNGLMDQLQQEGLFTPPDMKSMEQILIAGLQMNRGRVLMDLWDVQQFSTCQHCGSQRATQMAEMNRTQIVRSGVVCSECG